jgi:hypothetical protein
MNKITDEQDVRNSRQIRLMQYPWKDRATRDRLLRDGTPEERAAYVRRSNRMLMTAGAVFVIVIACTWLRPTSPKVASVPPVVEPAGVVQSVDLHETALSRTTSVRTDRGVYQVSGAVSWAPGDKATLRTDQEGSEKGRKQLCIASSIQSACFFLL